MILMQTSSGISFGNTPVAAIDHAMPNALGCSDRVPFE